MKKFTIKYLISSLVFLCSVLSWAQVSVPGVPLSQFSLIAILFENATTGVVVKALNGANPGVNVSGAGPFRVLVKSTSRGATLNCLFDNSTTVIGFPGTDGFACAVPVPCMTNGQHSVKILPSTGSNFFATYFMNASSVILPPPPPLPASTINCATGSCVQAAINQAPAGTAKAQQVVDFGGSGVSNCGSISLDNVKPYVTIQNLTLTGVTTDCSIGNTTAHASTNNVILNQITVNNGTHSKSLPSCGGGLGIASIVLYGSNNTVQNSTINGGTASGVFLGGFQNKVINSTFTGVNTNNATTMTACSGVLMAGPQSAVEFSTFNSCNGSCIHISPDTAYAAPLANQALSANVVVWGNVLNNGISNSFVGTPYAGDAGSLYTGWNDGHNSNIQYNQIIGLNPAGIGNKVCGGFSCAAGLYFDNNTSNYTAMHNWVDTRNSGYADLKINPQTLLQNPGDKLISGNRTIQNNTFVGTSKSWEQASMKVQLSDGTTAQMTSPDAGCPNVCNNSIVPAGTIPNFKAGVGSGPSLPPPAFLAP